MVIMLAIFGRSRRGWWTKLIEEVVGEDAIDTIVEVEDAIVEVKDDVAVEVICGSDTMKKSLDLQAKHKKFIECSRTN